MGAVAIACKACPWASSSLLEDVVVSPGAIDIGVMAWLGVTFEARQGRHPILSWLESIGDAHVGQGKK
eukprot:5542580-Prymnesium_polylepis.2